MKMEQAYIDEKSGQAICCWNAPDLKSVEGMFAKANVQPESIREVSIYA